MELSISKLSTSPSSNPQVSAPLCLLSFPTVPESGAPPLFAHQGAAPVIPCPASCLRLELSLDAPPQEIIQSPLFKHVITPALSHLGSCLSLELCLGVLPQVSIPHPTFLLTWVLQPRAGHRVTLSALVPSSKEFGFTHTKPFSNLNRPDHQQHSHSLYNPTSLIHVEDRPIPDEIHQTTLFNPDLSIDNTTTPPLLCSTLMRLLTPPQPLPITLQPAANKPTIHAATLSHPHTSTQPTTLTPWFLLLTILLLNFTFFSHLITFNSQTTTYPFQFLHELFQFSPVLTTPLGPHHDKLLLFNTMTSTHPDRAFSSTFPASSTTPPTTYSTTATPLPPPPPQPPPDSPSPPDCVERDPKKHNKKRSRSHSRTPQKQRDKENPRKLKKITTATQYTKPFNCYTINIRGLTQQKWKAILNHPSTKDPHAIVVTEHHLPFGHTPSYVTTSGWVFHTIQAPFKKDKDGNPILGTRGGILLATRKNTFAISGKMHHHTDLYQTATWTLSAGEFLPIINMTGVYLSPDNMVPTSEIKDLYTTLNNNFHVPSPHSPQNP